MNRNERVRQWRLKNLEERRAYDRKWYRKNRKRIREVKKLWREANREKVLLCQKISERKRRLRRETEKYGIVRPEVTICAIHGGEIVGSEICLDHDHRTGKFRGWLCVPCNAILGLFERLIGDERLLEGVQKYLGLRTKKWLKNRK